MASASGFGEFASDLREFADAIDDISYYLDEDEQGANTETAMKIAREATRRAPRGETGDLKDSIEQRPASGSRSQVVVGAPHGPLVEYGNGPGLIRPTTADYLHFTYKGTEYFRKEVNSYDEIRYLRPAIRKSKPFFNRSIAHHLHLLYEKHLDSN
jgi:hypothetical protein